MYATHSRIMRMNEKHVSEDSHMKKERINEKFENRNWLNIFSFCFTFVLCYMIERNGPSWCTLIIMMIRLVRLLSIVDAADTTTATSIHSLCSYICICIFSWIFPSFSTLSLVYILFKLEYTFAYIFNIMHTGGCVVCMWCVYEIRATAYFSSALGGCCCYKNISLNLRRVISISFIIHHTACIGSSR